MLWKNYFGVQTLYYFDKATSTFQFIGSAILSLQSAAPLCSGTNSGIGKALSKAVDPYVDQVFTTLGRQLKNRGWVWGILVHRTWDAPCP